VPLNFVLDQEGVEQEKEELRNPHRAFR
jgi:hypothetical protein